MPKFCGKDFLIQLETNTPGTYATLGGLTSNGMTINNEAVDVTDKGDMPWRLLLEGCGLRSMSLKGEGIVSDNAVFEQAQALALSGLHRNVKIISGAGDTFVGKFQLTSFDRSGEKNNAEMFSLALESSGVVTYTAAP